MSRAKGPRLYLRPGNPRKQQKAAWVIRDGGAERSTGCGEADLIGAEKAFAAYLAQKHDPAKERRRAGDPALARLPDVISLYAKEIATGHARPEETGRRLGKVLEYFGDVPLSLIDRSACIAYAKTRPAQAARRELEDLRASINHWFGDALVAARINIHLPEKAKGRENWHTRSQVAKMLWTAWRAKQALPKGGYRYTSRHIARFILLAVYTGTRATAVCGAAIRPTIGRGYVDLEQGVFYRRPQGERETMKRRPPARLHPRLLAHLRRWERLGISGQSVIEWNGQPILRVSKGYAAVSRAAGVKSSPHVLRHTAVTWAMQNGAPMYQAAEYFGMSVEMIERNYGHHHPDHHAGVVAAIGGR